MNIISLENVSKVYSVKEQDTKKRKEIHAVKDISLDIKQGEFVGLIGNNGAGKSTLIKMMTGILYNSSGKIKLLGKDAFEKRLKNNRHISVVFGQKSQLNWDLSPMDSFELLQAIYDIDKEVYAQNIESFVQLFGIDEFKNQAVRTLSLGQKMKCEIAAAFLHNPSVVFLDEPTIGLDIFSKDNIIEFLKTMKAKKNVSLILTSHDMNDISQVCDRIICLDQGEIILDKDIADVRNMKSNQVTVIINTENKKPLGVEGDDIQLEDYKIIFHALDRRKITDCIEKVIQKNTIMDIAIEEENFTDIVKKIYNNRM